MGSGSAWELRVAALRAAVAEQNPDSWGAAYGIAVSLVDPADGDVDALLEEALTPWATDEWGEPAAAVSLIEPPPAPLETEPEPEPASPAASEEDPPAWFVPDPDPDPDLAVSDPLNRL